MSSILRGEYHEGGDGVFSQAVPCFREFEGEQLCVNDKEIRKMTAIDV